MIGDIFVAQARDNPGMEMVRTIVMMPTYFNGEIIIADTWDLEV
jgi:hypothetical protein